LEGVSFVSLEYQFNAVIQNEGSGGAFVVVPFDVEKAFGKKRVKVIATIDSEEYRGSLVRMGGPDHLLIILKEIREKIGKTFGDEVTVFLKEDTLPRKVDVPEDLKERFKENPEAEIFFNQLAYTYQKEYVQWIESAKREETRLRRLEKTIDLLNQGKKLS
jgi:succinate dehydrogenase/fumarate reductase flavoprotein subunit